jgi:hypothetical protein
MQLGADVPHRRFGRFSIWRSSMRSRLRYTLLFASLLVAFGGISGCSNEPESQSGKMDTGKMAGPMDKMDSGKMAGPMDKMDSGKMATDKK